MNAETRSIRWRNDHRPVCTDIRDRASRGLIVLGALMFVLLGAGIASADDHVHDGHKGNQEQVTIERATWDAGRQRLEIRGQKDRRAAVRVVNAADPTQLIGADNDRRDDNWGVRVRGPSPVPCNVRALSDGGDMAEAKVRNAPSNCGGTPPPIENAPPTANAGPDQNVTLPPGFTNMAVTLNGGGSGDSDGSLTGWTWTGTPNPDDVVSPTVMLAAGTYSFSLVVTDDDGAASTADEVSVTVNPPVIGGDPHATITAYNGPSTCVACHESEAQAMHGSVHYQQSGPTDYATNIPGPAGERWNGAPGKASPASTPTAVPTRPVRASPAPVAMSATAASRRRRRSSAAWIRQRSSRSSATSIA
jgi:hypothetical protein